MNGEDGQSRVAVLNRMYADDRRKMIVEELRTRTDELRAVVLDAVTKFHADTGCCVTGIDVSRDEIVGLRGDRINTNYDVRVTAEV